MDLPTLTNLYSVHVLTCIALILKGVSCASTACEAGKYNSYGYCQPCTICPGQGAGVNLNHWLVEECIEAFVYCPHLCKVSSLAWTHEADESICLSLAYPSTRSPTTTKVPTTTVPTTTTVATTTAETTMADLSNRHTQMNEDDVQLPKSGFNDSPNTGEELGNNTLFWTVLGVTLTLVTILAGMALVKLLLHCKQQRLKIRDGESNIGLSDNSAILSDIWSSATSITVRLGKQARSYHLRIDVWHQDKTLSSQSTNDLTSEEVIFSDGILPKTNYSLKLMEFNISTKTWEERDEKTISTLDVFDVTNTDTPLTAEFYDRNHFQIRGVPAELSSRGLCVKSCACYMKTSQMLSKTKSSSDVILIQGESFVWNWLPVSLCIPGIEDHVVGQTQIQWKGPVEITSTKCCKFVDGALPLLQEFERLLNPCTNMKHCIVMLYIGNSLSSIPDLFPNDLLKCTSGSDFFQQYHNQFMGTEDVEICTILTKLLSPDICDCKNEVKDIVAVFQRHHECAKCKAFIHKMLCEDVAPKVKCCNGFDTVV